MSFILNGKLKNEHSLNEIFSSLVQEPISELEKQMSEDEYTRTLLTTRGEDLPFKYSFLLGELYADWYDLTLYDFIKQTYNKVGADKVYFSKSGNKITGFAAYQVDNSLKFEKFPYVSEIKIFSFDITKPNPVLFKDLKELIEKLTNKYKKVSWVVVTINPANKIYKEVLEYYRTKGFVCTHEELNDRLTDYSISWKEE